MKYNIIHSQNDEEMSDGEESGREHDEVDSCDDINGGGDDRIRNNIMAEHGDVLSKLKMQVGSLKTSEEFDMRQMERQVSFPNIANMLHLQDRFPLPAPFPFPHPGAAFLPSIPQPQPIAPSSGSSHSSEGSASSQHTWSFEEQFKQVRQVGRSSC
ncbi:hypothetical protein WA026_015126 [Henosepilachna vigintioctopunctata]|uniref:Uncharacterized protein n=1 Tax=Henosepilachna vigintioctopunctata TaxID=420089 RepID=A0AAW1TUV3_9CUCU